MKLNQTVRLALRQARTVSGAVVFLALLTATHWWMFTWYLPPRPQNGTGVLSDAAGPANATLPTTNGTTRTGRGRFSQGSPLFPLPPPPPLHNEEPTLPPERRSMISTTSPSLPKLHQQATSSRNGDRGSALRGKGTFSSEPAARHSDRSYDPLTPLSSEESIAAFYAKLQCFETNLQLKNISGNPEQPTKDFIDIDTNDETGSPLPYDPSFMEEAARWEACDPRNASFSKDRDELCQQYLRNLNNMRRIKALPTKLLQGRTIKMQITYAHHNIKVIVKLSQRKFFFEAVSEYWAYSFDRALGFHRVPTSAFIAMPLDYLRSAVAFSPLFSQWFNRFVVLYNYTNANFVECNYFTRAVSECTMATAQLWMMDVHPALETFLAIPYEIDDAFIRKYYVPGHDLSTNTKRARLRAVGEVLDRSIFDFLIGNSDRGTNDHNNFVYGGCSASTECAVEMQERRLKGLAKYAYLDHGSSLYSHKEVRDSPFFGSVDRIHICRYRRSTFDHLQQFASTSRDPYPLIRYVEKTVPSSMYAVSHESVIRKVQVRLDKILHLIEQCRVKFTDTGVFSMPEYDAVRIAEEDATLGDEWG